MSPRGPGGPRVVDVEAEEGRVLDREPGPRPRPRGCLGTLAAVAAVVVGTVYVLNPGAGMIEILPDVLPGIGNLDEAGATALVLLGLQYLFGSRRRE